MQSPWLRSKQSIAESWLRREHRDRDLPLLPLPVLPEAQAAVHHQEAAQADVLLHQEAATAHGGAQAAHHQAVVHQVVQVAVAQARRVIVAHQAAQAVREQVQQL